MSSTVSIQEIVTSTLAKFQRNDPSQYDSIIMDKPQYDKLCEDISNAVEKYLKKEGSMKCIGNIDGSIMERASVKDVQQPLNVETLCVIMGSSAVRGESDCVTVSIHRRGALFMESRAMSRFEDIFWAGNVQYASLITQIFLSILYIADVTVTIIEDSTMQIITDKLLQAFKDNKYPKLTTLLHDLRKAHEAKSQVVKPIYAILAECHANECLWSIVTHLLCNHEDRITTACRVEGVMMATLATSDSLPVQLELALTALAGSELLQGQMDHLVTINGLMEEKMSIFQVSDSDST